MRRDLFAGTRTPQAPDDLRERALQAARAATRQEPAPTRARWGFTRLDLVWGAALVLLVVVNVMLTRSNRPTAAASARPQARDVREERIAGPEADRDLMALGLRLDAASPHSPEPSLSLEQALRAGS